MRSLTRPLPSPRCNRLTYSELGGRVLFLSSVATTISDFPPAALLYTSTKGAVEQITRVLAKDLGARGIAVNAIAPGPTDTDMFLKAWPSEFVQAAAAAHPLKRLAKADEIAPLVAFLSSEEAGWINGQIISVDNVRIQSIYYVGTPTNKHCSHRVMRCSES